MRLDALLAQRRLFKSRSAAARAIEDNRVFINELPAQKKYLITEGDSITCQVDTLAPFELKSSSIELDIRYEDDSVIVLSKQTGLVCHPSVEHVDDTLVNALIYKYGTDGLCNLQGQGDSRLGIVHRLDRDTSGLMMVAKTNDSGRNLIEQIANRTVDRHYIALAHGIINVDTGMIDAPVGRHPANRMRMAVGDISSSRDAITTFSVIERFSPGKYDDGFTLLDCKLFTGRTHQIRVHMEYIKHPIVGDPVYVANGPKSAEAQCGLNRQFLHSYKLMFTHPCSGKPIQVTEQLPADLDSVLEILSSRSIGRTQFGINLFEDLEGRTQPKLPPFRPSI